METLDNREVIREISSRVTSNIQAIIAYCDNLPVTKKFHDYRIIRSQGGSIEDIFLQKISAPELFLRNPIPDGSKVLRQVEIEIDHSVGQVVNLKVGDVEYKFNPRTQTIELLGCVTSPHSLDEFTYTYYDPPRPSPAPVNEVTKSSIKMNISPTEATLREENSGGILRSIHYDLMKGPDGLVWIPSCARLFTNQRYSDIGPKELNNLLPSKILHFVTTWENSTPGTPIWNTDPNTGEITIGEINTDPKRATDGIPMEYFVHLITSQILDDFRDHYKYRPYQPLSYRIGEMYEKEDYRFNGNSLTLLRYREIDDYNIYYITTYLKWLLDLTHGNPQFTAIINQGENTHVHHIEVKHKIIIEPDKPYVIDFEITIDDEIYSVALETPSLATKTYSQEELISRINPEAEVRYRLEKNGFEIVDISRTVDNGNPAIKATYKKPEKDAIEECTRDAIIQAIEAKYSTE